MLSAELEIEIHRWTQCSYTDSLLCCGMEERHGSMQRWRWRCIDMRGSVVRDSLCSASVRADVMTDRCAEVVFNSSSSSSSGGGRGGVCVCVADSDKLLQTDYHQSTVHRRT